MLRGLHIHLYILFFVTAFTICILQSLIYLPASKSPKITKMYTKQVYI